jgi:hypothetical protein
VLCLDLILGNEITPRRGAEIAIQIDALAVEHAPFTTVKRINCAGEVALD